MLRDTNPSGASCIHSRLPSSEPSWSPQRLAIVTPRPNRSVRAKDPVGWGVGFLCLLGSLIVLRPVVCVAANAPHMRATLRGLQGVQVVEDIDPDAERNGLDRMQLQAAIESWLRQANIRVWPRDKGWEQSRHPTLYVRVTTAKDGHSDLYAVNVGVELQQEVTLVHNPSLRIIAPTWSTARIGILRAKQIPAIRDDIGADVADFIQDYRMVNPTQLPEAGPLPPAE